MDTSRQASLCLFGVFLTHTGPIPVPVCVGSPSRCIPPLSRQTELSHFLLHPPLFGLYSLWLIPLLSASSLPSRRGDALHAPTFEVRIRPVLGVRGACFYLVVRWCTFSTFVWVRSIWAVVRPSSRCPPRCNQSRTPPNSTAYSICPFSLLIVDPRFLRYWSFPYFPVVVLVLGAPRRTGVVPCGVTCSRFCCNFAGSVGGGWRFRVVGAPSCRIFSPQGGMGRPSWRAVRWASCVGVCVVVGAVHFRSQRLDRVYLFLVPLG